MRSHLRALRRAVPEGMPRRARFRPVHALVLILAGAWSPASFAQQSEASIATADDGAASNASGIDTDVQTFPIAAWSRTDALAEDLGAPEERGRAVFNNWCGACHSRDTRNAPGTRSLEFKYRGELPAAIEDRTDLTAEMVAFYVRNGVATMPFYRLTEISDADLKALAVYLAD